MNDLIGKMMTGINIRKAEDKDIDPICDLFAETDKLHRIAHPEIFIEPNKPEINKDYYLSCINNAYSEIFIGIKGRKIVGAILCTINQSTNHPILKSRSYCNIENISVEESNRNMNIGKSLMDQAQEWARSKGARTVELSVWEFNRNAIQFYRQLGYQPIRSRMHKDLI